MSNLSTLFYISLIYLVSECKSKNYCSQNNCRNTQLHTLCKFHSPDPAKHCLEFDQTIKNDEDRNVILYKLNSRRNKVAAGEIRSLPSSADMMKLEWNTELEKFAQRWANQCVRNNFPDLKDECRDLDDVSVGQNIATILGDSPGLTPSALVDVWYMELLSINQTILNRFQESKYSGFNHYDYFSQLVWSESSEVGCAGVKFKDREGGNRTVYRLVCNFAPGGNRPNQSVYRYGIPCSQCPADSFCDSHFKALCGKRMKLSNPDISNSTKEELPLEYEAYEKVSKVAKISETATETMELKNSVTDTDEEAFTPFDFFSHVHDFTRQLVTAAVTKHDCKDTLSVDNFIDLLRKRLSSDPAFKELLFSTKLPTLTGFIDSSFTDPSVAAFVSKLYSKKKSTTTTKIAESNVLNSTLLVDLVEAVIFRSNSGNDKIQITEDAEHTTQYESQVSPVKIQAELARIQQNSDFTGHYFFPEDDDETTSETTEVYYDTSNIPIQDVMMEIEDIKKSTVTIDFLDEIFEADPVTETTATASQLSPDDMTVYKSGHSVMKKFLEDITDKTPEIPV